MINKKINAKLFVALFLVATVAILLSQNTSSTTTEVLVEWYYIHCEETHDALGKGEFYIKIRWKENGNYQYYTYDVVKLAADENDYPDQFYAFDADYPGTIDVQLWEEDIGSDDLIIDWRSTNIPSTSTFSWEYESPPGGCYIRIDIDNI